MDLEKLSFDIKAHGGTWFGLLACLLLPLVVLSLIPAEVWIPRLYWIALVFLELLTVVLWWVFLRRGGLGSSKLRLVLAIYCDKEEQRAELEEDFIKTLRQILRAGDLGKDIKLITASKDEAKRVECDDHLVDLSDRKHAHLLLYGRIRTRTEGSGDVHRVELRAIVRHARLAERAKAAFQEEISSIFPAQLKIPKSDQLPHFKITADWVGFASRYMLSMAAFTVGDLDYSNKILRDAECILSRLPADIKQKASLGQRLSARQFEVAVLQAHKNYADWRLSRKAEHIDAICERLEFAQTKARLQPRHVHMLASANFVKTWDAVSAERMIRSAMFEHAVAHLNLAFLSAWQDKFEVARKSYRSGAKKRPDQDVCAQVFTFFEWMARVNSDRAYIGSWCEAIFRISIKQDVEKSIRILSYLVRQADKFPGDEIARMREDIAKLQGEG